MKTLLIAAMLLSLTACQGLGLRVVSVSAEVSRDRSCHSRCHDDHDRRDRHDHGKHKGRRH